MRSKLLLIAACTGLAACNAPDAPRAGLESIKIPVVSRATYVYDAVAPGGVLAPGEGERLDAWFRSLDVRYGDNVYVDGADDGPARVQVAHVAGDYGLLVSAGAPVTPGAIIPGTIRVLVSRNEARVPNCPDWSSMSQPNFNNDTPSNFGCGVNSAFAAQIANPEDLLHGRAGNAAEDGATAAKAIRLYRDWPLTAVIEGQSRRPLKNVESTTSKDK